MKKIGLLAIAAVVLTATAWASEIVEEELRYRPDPQPPFCIARGITNLASGWLEIPRCVIYNNTLHPGVGMITGLGEGVGMTVMRALSGVYDVVSFGSSGDSLHSNAYPDLVFEAVWVPEKAASDE